MVPLTAFRKADNLIEFSGRISTESIRRMCMESTLLVTHRLRFSSVYAAVKRVHGCAEAHLPAAENILDFLSALKASSKRVKNARKRIQRAIYQVRKRARAAAQEHTCSICLHSRHIPTGSYASKQATSLQ